MKNTLPLLLLTALVGNVQAVESSQNDLLNQFEHQLVTAWLKNPDLARDIRRIKECHKVQDQGKINHLPLQTVTSFLDPTLGTIHPPILKQILQQIDFAFEEHNAKTEWGNCQLPVAFMKQGDTVVAAYINDTRPTGNIDQRNMQNSQVNKLIKNLHDQHGTNLPIVVNTPHRNPSFSLATGTLYSSAKEINVSDSHDLTMHGGTGGTVKVSHHKGDFRTNADHVTIWNPINLNLTCDNKKADIKIPIPHHIQAGYRGVVTLNDHQGSVVASGDTITVKMKNHSGNVVIGNVVIGYKAKAIIENAKIDHLLLHNDGDALIVNGQIKALLSAKGGTAWLVDSTVHNSKSYGSKPDIYLINTEGDLSKAPGMLEEILKDKDGSNEAKQKTMNAFNALWDQRQMPNKHIPEEHKE